MIGSTSGAYTQMTPGGYTFTIPLVITLVNSAATFQIDPEMDIQS